MPAPANPSWRVLLPLAALAVAAVVLGPLYLGSVGGDVGAAGCTLAAWLGLHSPVPSFLKGKPHYAKMAATMCAGLALKLHDALPTLIGGNVQHVAVWLIILVCCAAAGKPLTMDFGDVEDAPAGGGQ